MVTEPNGRREAGLAHLKLLALTAAIVAVVATVAAVILVLGPAPPGSITMATGPEGGAYHRLGERYREMFARHRVDLRLLTTNGSVDNLEK